MITPPVLLDTCVVLSLCASRRMAEILDANMGPFLIAEAVLHETLYIHVVIDGVREKEPVSLDPLLAAGKLAVVAPETEDEFQELFNLAQLLDDGEAMTCAIALRRGYRMATDERKSIRLVGERVPIVGTLDLVRAWANAETTPPTLVREVLLAIADRGYVPGSNHPHYSWWSRMLPGSTE